MNDRTPPASATLEPADLHAAPALDLLAPGAGVPPRYRQVFAQLQDWGLPADLAQLGLLMRRVERGAVAPAQIEPVLGPRAAAAAASLADLASAPRPSLRHVERVWQLFMLACLHPSAGVLKIAEILVQLRGAHESAAGVDPDVILAAAYASVRLGMGDVRTELLNSRAQLADPHLAQRARTFLDRSQPARVQFFEALRQDLAGLLQSHGLDARIERRPRPIYQVVDDGLESARSSFPWADIVILLLDDREACYRALGAINSSYPVVGAKIRDYIGGPKDNGYQAIHTTVVYTAALAGDRTAPVEIHLATAEMDHYNRAGYLAYLAGAPPHAPPPAWLVDRARWQAACHEASPELFVFTPQGETIFLPRGATVLDFAVRVHLDLGVYCQGALVNGNRTSPGGQLECGDICEVLIDQRGEPIDQRLLDLASTNVAKARIRRALQKDRPGAVRGQQIFETVLAERLEEQEVRADQTTIGQQVAAICRARGYQSVDAFYRAVGRGEAAPDRVIRTIVEQILLPRVDFAAAPAEVRARARLMRLAECCRPRPSRPAVAVAIHGGYQLKVHTAGCPAAGEPAYPVAWKPIEDRALVADVLYESWDRPGLIHQVTQAIAQVGTINIRMFAADVPEPWLARIRFSFEAQSKAQVDQVRHALEQLPERRHVDLRAVTLIDEGVRLAEPLDNPYSPHPVGRWPLFVGRDAQVRQIVAQLGGRSGAGHILVHGPKRIGKSSLLQHLSRYHLSNFRVPALLDLQSLPTDELRFPRLLSHLSELILQKAGPHARVGPLDPAAIERDPIRAFAGFLANLRAQADLDRFIVLIDELGVILSRLRGSGLEAEFFDQWRAMLNDEAVYTHLAFIVAMPDAALQPGRDGPRVPFRAGELGYPVRLLVLDPDDARDLITAPIRTHLAYQASDLELLLRETGGHPYYIHLVCSQIITAIQAQQRRIGTPTRGRQQIDSALVRAGLEAVLANKDAFHHVLADNTPGTSAVLRAVAALTGPERPAARRARLRVRLRRLDPQYGDGTLAWAIEERPDLLFEQEDEIGIRVNLVARWLRRHVIYPPLEGDGLAPGSFDTQTQEPRR